MNPRLRKAVGGIGMLAFLGLYVVAAVTIAGHLPNNRAVQLVYFVVAPMALHFFLGMQQTNPGDVQIEMQTRVSEYLGFVMTLIIAFGICFQLPVILTLLARIELVNTKQLAKGRKYAIVGILAVAALLTPPDPISQIGLSLPMYALYEISILSVRWVERQRAAKEAAEAAKA